MDDKGTTIFHPVRYSKVKSSDYMFVFNCVVKNININVEKKQALVNTVMNILVP
jgi:hypothetical protein